jgi:7-carboxy-7-deazaguanine synthase
MKQDTQKTVKVSEIFLSIQSEGRLVGVPSAFIRLAGCNLRCKWCDTAYSWDRRRGKSYTLAEILQQVRHYNCRHIVLTGGEPLLTDELDTLLELLSQTGKHITVETAASSYRDIKCDLISISPKLSNSAAPDNQQQRLNIQAIAEFIRQYDYQLKFVVSGPDDMPEVEDVLAKLPDLDRQKVMLMPMASTKAQYRQIAPIVAQMCIDNNFRYCNRLHLELWGNRRGR